MRGDAELLVKGGLERLIGCELGFGSDYVAVGRRAGKTSLAHEIEILSVNLENVLYGP